MPRTAFSVPLADGVKMVVRFDTEGNEVAKYAVALVLEYEGGWHTARLFDNAHGRNEMHRYNRGTGKQPPEEFLGGSAKEGLRHAQNHIREHWERILDSWLRQ